ncbi:hypothetical protein [Knoellia sp. LjRoot47]|uniref:hypothetical protein n=1 Tax=Knoellia sp. LjRoot47 TaxID=3342330 RepID=UPI003ECE0101
MSTVHVRIEWPSGEPLPDDACARIAVEDVSALDAPSTVVAETVVEDLDTTGATEADLDVPDVEAGTDLVVRVHVTPSARRGTPVQVGDLVTTQAHPVLTRGHGASVVVQPRRVG